MKNFIIGSAQFGSNYGVTNDNLLLKKDIFKILDEARKSSIKSIDTAPSYGESERIIGEYKKNDFEITTKIPKYQNSSLSFLDWIKGSINLSLRNLNTTKIKNILFHDLNDCKEFLDQDCIDYLLDLKEKKVISGLGFSLYDEKDIGEAIEIFEPDIIQLPFNVMDTRFENNFLVKELKQRNVSMVARSIFLQGMLLNDDPKYRSIFGKKSVIFDEWFLYCKNNYITPLKACIDFIKSSSVFDSFVVGASSLSEFLSIVEAFNTSSVVKLEFRAENDINIIDPRKWKI